MKSSILRDLERRLESIDKATLGIPVQRCLGIAEVEIVDWLYIPVRGGFGQSYGIYRFSGRARSGGHLTDWSLILKVVGPASGDEAPSAASYWKREALVYRSGILDSLPADLVVPRCLGITEFADGETWLWLEDIGPITDDPWPIERYGLVAHALGQFNGQYLVSRPIPDVPWLWTVALRERLAAAEQGVGRLRELSCHPLFTGLASGDTVDRMVGLWEQRERLLNALDHQSRTLCHHDAFRRNLTTRRGPDGREQIVLFDWARLGIGFVGQEIVPLFAASLRFVPADIKAMTDLEGRIYSGYLDGLRDAGWEGDPRSVRLCYAAISALEVGIAEPATRWPQVVERVAALPAGSEPPRLLGPGMRQSAALRRHLLAMGEEALDIVDSFG
jgi:hypothetical protein